MANISYNILWESEFDNIVFKWIKLQDTNINQFKLEVHDIYKKDERIATNFEISNDEDVINKFYLFEHLLKIHGHLSLSEEDKILNYNTTNNL